MSWNRFIDTVQRRTRLDDRHLAEAAALATMTVLGERLPRIDADAVADELPERLAEPLRAGDHAGEFGRDQFFERIARLENQPLARALEHATVVCQVLAETVGPEGLTHLRQHLPEELAELFHRQAPSSPPYHPPGAGRVPHRASDLATGRPGARASLAESRPPAHEHSVANEDNPHADSKVSSGQTTQERHRETLSSGQPGSSKPISESRD